MGDFNFLDKTEQPAPSAPSRVRPVYTRAPGILTPQSNRQLLLLTAGGMMIAFSLVVIVGLLMRERRVTEAASQNPAPGIDQRQFEVH